MFNHVAVSYICDHVLRGGCGSALRGSKILTSDLSMDTTVTYICNQAANSGALFTGSETFRLKKTVSLLVCLECIILFS